MKHLSSLNNYFWKYHWHFMPGFVFVALTNYFCILAPHLTGYAENTVIQSVKSSNVNEIDIKSCEKNYDFVVRKVIATFDDNTGNKILFAGITLFIIAIISGFFMFLMRQTIIVMSRHIEYEQKNEIFTHYQKPDTNFYKTYSTGNLENPRKLTPSRLLKLLQPVRFPNRNKISPV